MSRACWSCLPVRRVMSPGSRTQRRMSSSSPSFHAAAFWTAVRPNMSRPAGSIASSITSWRTRSWSAGYSIHLLRAFRAGALNCGWLLRYAWVFPSAVLVTCLVVMALSSRVRSPRALTALRNSLCSEGSVVPSCTMVMEGGGGGGRGSPLSSYHSLNTSTTSEWHRPPFCSCAICSAVWCHLSSASTCMSPRRSRSATTAGCPPAVATWRRVSCHSLRSARQSGLWSSRRRIVVSWPTLAAIMGALIPRLSRIPRRSSPTPSSPARSMTSPILSMSPYSLANISSVLPLPSVSSST
mmetsp:Transcript_10610/g.29747  ORF Transcript_10610/g.29747 Transcript_10610/m.29747 type:complete len:297 (-) Transcript_10610:116-1006(-)